MGDGLLLVSPYTPVQNLELLRTGSAGFQVCLFFNLGSFPSGMQG